MLLNQIILGIFGLSFGLLSSAGVFTVLSSVGLIPRFAGGSRDLWNDPWVHCQCISGLLSGRELSAFQGALWRIYSSSSQSGRDSISLLLWILIRDLYRMSGLCHCRNAGFYPDLCKESIIPARSWGCHSGGSFWKALWQFVLFFQTDLFVRDVIVLKKKEKLIKMDVHM